MAKLIVINASPLIFLSRGQHIELLRYFGDRIVIPKPVADEILRRGSEDLTAKAIESTPWIEIVSSIKIPPHILEWSLGTGESSVLAYAASHPGTEVVIDDLAGRKCAACLNIPVRGTLGIILIAKKRGLIPFARPVLETLLRSGMYLSRSVLDQALRQVGE